MLGDIDLVVHYAAMQAFIEKHVGVIADIFPRRKSSWLLLIRRRLFIVMQVIAYFSGASLTVITEKALQLLKVISVWTEVAQVLATGLRFGNLVTHLVTIVFVKTIALDNTCLKAFAKENMLQRSLDGTGTGA